MKQEEPRTNTMCIEFYINKLLYIDEPGFWHRNWKRAYTHNDTINTTDTVACQYRKYSFGEKAQFL